MLAASVVFLHQKSPLNGYLAIITTHCLQRLSANTRCTSSTHTFSHTHTHSHMAILYTCCLQRYVSIWEKMYYWTICKLASWGRPTAYLLVVLASQRRDFWVFWLHYMMADSEWIWLPWFSCFVNKPKRWWLTQTFLRLSYRHTTQVTRILLVNWVKRIDHQGICAEEYVYCFVWYIQYIVI